MVGISRWTITAWMRRGMFPEPMICGIKRLRWTDESIQAWLAANPNPGYKIPSFRD